MPNRLTIRAAGAVLALALALLVAACAAPAAQPTVPPSPAAPTPTAAPPSPTAPPTTAPTPAPSPTAGSVSAAASPSAAARAPATAAATLPDGSLRLALAPEGNEARYRAREQLVGQSLPSDAIGRTTGVSGAIVLSAGGAVAREQSKIVVDLRGLKSNESRRDNWLQRSTLETSRFPNAEFVPIEVKGLPSPLPTDGEVRFQLLGELTLKGVTRPSTWEVTARFTPADVAGAATTTFTLTEFNIPPPRVGPVLSIEETIALELDFKALRAAPAAGQLAAAPSGTAIAAGGAGAAAAPPATVRPAAVAAAPAAATATPAARPVPASCEPTRPDAEGPFYKPNAPVRASVGTGYRLAGVVRSAAGCGAIGGARLEFWLANPGGEYDDAHRATVIAGPAGDYQFESNLPAPYGGRPPHVHVRVAAPGFRPLITQHYPSAGQTTAPFDLVLVPA